MKSLTIALLSTFALGGVALAEQPAAPAGSTQSDPQKSDKMKGPPNADGAQKSDGKADTTGTGTEGAAAAKSTGEADGKKPSGH